jgi:hypothetical protein
MEQKDSKECVGADEIEEKTVYELQRDKRVVELAKLFLPIQAAANNL